MHSDRLSAHTINAVLGDASFIHTFGFPPPPETDERTRISTHLAYVEQLLRAAPVQHLASEQRQKRAFLLDKLHEYWQQGRFPKNTAFPHERRPCFIDDEGSICAVGYLVEKDSGRVVAERINADFQYEYVQQMDAPLVQEWVQQSGLSVAECTMIQPTYGEPRKRKNYFREHSLASGNINRIKSSSETVNSFIRDYDIIHDDEALNLIKLFTKEINNSAEHLRYLFDNLFLYIKLQNILIDPLNIQDYREYNSTYSTTEPLFFAEEVKNIFHFYATDKERTNDIQVEVEDVGIAMYRAHTIQLIQEIACNAFDYSYLGSPINVVGRVDGTMYRLSVEDKGRGMDEHLVSCLSTPNKYGPIYYMNRRYRTEQLDLGISIVKMILDIYGGTMTIESARGEGTTVTLHLPIAVPEG